MDYTGKTLEELSTLVDTTLDVYGRLQRASKPRMVKHLYGCTCMHCNFAYEDHGAFNDACPNGETRFREQLCEASIPLNSDGTQAIECGNRCVPGTRLCKEHCDE